MTEDPIFRPLNVGSLRLPNRVVMTTVKLGYATPAGEVTDRHVAFYARRAAGGVGLPPVYPIMREHLRLGNHVTLIAGFRSSTAAQR